MDHSCAEVALPRHVQILVVEDELLVRELVKDVLVEAGYEPRCEAAGKQAIAALNGQQQFSGLVTDIKLADSTTGWEIAHHARELNPEIAVIYMSGDSGCDYAAEGVPNSTFLQKPFAPDRITTALSTLLNKISQ